MSSAIDTRSKTPAFSSRFGREELARLAKETATKAGRPDLLGVLVGPAERGLPAWRAEFDPTRKKTLAGFVGLRLADLLTSLVLQSEGKAPASLVAYLLHADDIRAMASTLVRQHKLTWLDADDFAHSGRTVVAKLMASFDPRLSFHGYAFSQMQGRPSLVYKGLLDALCNVLHVTQDQYRKAKRLRHALKAFRLECGREPSETELAERLGVARLATVRRHRHLMEVCFGGLVQPMAEPRDDSGGDSDENGMYGEADAYVAGEREKGQHSDVRSALNQLAELRPNQAVALAHVYGFGLTERGEALLKSMSDVARRQNVCRGKAAFRLL